LFSEKKRTAYSAETIRKRIPIPGIEPEWEPGILTTRPLSDLMKHVF
jgi:hypothetical protein